MTTFAALLAEYRVRAGLSQSKLADKAGLTHSFLSRLESGNRNPHRPTVEALATALELNAADTARLLTAAGYAADVDPIVSDLAAFLADASVDVRVSADVRYMVRTALRMARRERAA